jgi:RND family efflux transporter MFP subunit
MKKLSTLLILTGLVLVACKPAGENKANALPSHQVIKPLVKDAVYTNEYVAEIHSLHYVEVRSRIKGYLEKIHADEGQYVKEGQLLFTLNKLEFEKELQKAIAMHKNAVADLKASEVDLANVRKLVDKDIVSNTELNVALAKVEALQADVEEAQANKDKVMLELSFTQIKAPYHGQINRIPKKAGSLIAEGDMLTSISDNREVFAYFNLSETDYLNYIAKDAEKTETVKLRLANNLFYPYDGKVEMIESEFDRSTGNIAFRARFPNPKDTLKHGAHGEIVVSKFMSNVLQIPQKSVFEIQDKLFVFIVKPDGVLEQRQIVPQLRLTDYFVVASGLTKDDTILFEGAESVRHGNKIDPVPVDVAKVMPAAPSQ